LLERCGIFYRCAGKAERVSADHFQADGSFFSMAGSWRVEASISRDEKPSLQVPFDLAIASPGEASGPLNPLSADSQTLTAGRLLYQTNCALCHGASGRGDGPAAGPSSAGITFWSK
jgi:mono/diheme cytochrome c family protein